MPFTNPRLLANRPILMTTTLVDKKFLFLFFGFFKIKIKIKNYQIILNTKYPKLLLFYVTTKHFSKKKSSSKIMNKHSFVMA
jgi:hypothetical protein